MTSDENLEKAKTVWQKIVDDLHDRGCKMRFCKNVDVDVVDDTQSEFIKTALDLVRDDTLSKIQALCHDMRDGKLSDDVDLSDWGAGYTHALIEIESKLKTLRGPK